MDKRGKVVTGVEFCANDDYDCENEGCPYNDLYGKGCIGRMMLDAYELLKDPDLVKVVRCQDCRHWEPENAEEGDLSGHCRNNYAPCQNQQTYMNWFCWDGERK